MTWAELKSIIDSMNAEELKKDVVLWDVNSGRFYNADECSEYDPINDPHEDYSIGFHSNHHWY